MIYIKVNLRIGIKNLKREILHCVQDDRRNRDPSAGLRMTEFLVILDTHSCHTECNEEPLLPVIPNAMRNLGLIVHCKFIKVDYNSNKIEISVGL